jgi:UDP-N-acetyl-2-amino-2-deoxyglucuronate dehydrogenase
MSDSMSLRVGIVGCGYQGGVIAKAIALLPSLHVVACADPDRAAAAKFMAHAPDATHYSSVEDLLEQAEPDAVIIATPHHLLYDTALAVIGAGKHALVEKPIGMDEKEAAQLEEAAGQAGICFMAGYSFRYLPAWQQVHGLLQAGAVGQIQAIVGSIGTRPMTSGWQAAPETGGGPLLYVGSHLIDQILWYLNDTPTKVFADVRYRAETRADGIAAFQISFAQGATAQCLVTQHGKGLFNYLDIYGSEGHITLRTVGFLDYAVGVQSNVLPADAPPAAVPSQPDKPRAEDPRPEDPRMVKHKAQLQEFVQAIHERRQPAVTVGDGRRVLKVLDAVIRSSRTGGPVCIG